jgi:uncharacterized OsmC-like protein
MASRDIAAALERTERALKRRPSAGLQPDPPCLARWTGGARVVARDPRGREVVTDLSAALGGDDEGPSPGWLIRAGIANCMVTCIAITAARASIELERLEVDVASRSDARGLFGMAEPDGAPVLSGPRDVEMTVRIAAGGVPAQRLRGLVQAAEAFSPVQAVIERPTRVAIRVEIG